MGDFLEKQKILLIESALAGLFENTRISKFILKEIKAGSVEISYFLVMNSSAQAVATADDNCLMYQ